MGNFNFLSSRNPPEIGRSDVIQEKKETKSQEKEEHMVKL